MNEKKDELNSRPEVHERIKKEGKRGEKKEKQNVFLDYSHRNETIVHHFSTDFLNYYIILSPVFNLGMTGSISKN